MTRLFISYSRVDRETAYHIIERLRDVYEHDQVWFDEELHGGVRWWQAITTQVAECDVFIYLLSNESVTSPYCKAEFTEAKRLQKPIVTVQIRDKTRLSADLSEIQYVDMKRGMNDDTLARLIRAINEQAALPKKRRALWTPVTPIPHIPTSEGSDASSRLDVETPTLEVNAPVGDGKVARATITAAIIIGVFALLAVILSNVLPPLINPTLAAPPTQIVAQNTTHNEPAVGTPTSTNTPDLMLIVGQTQTYEVERTLTVIPAATFTPTVDFQATIDTIAAGTRAGLQTANAATLSAMPTQTPIPPTATSTLTPVPPTHTPIPPTQVTIPLGYPGKPVTSNDQWTPVTQEFNGVTMVLVPAGCFDMGNDPDAYDWVANRQGVGSGGRQCFDEPFWIDQTEVTQADFERLGGVQADPPDFPGDDRPVEDIIWFEARDFCESRDARLPTEAEWEYAARGPSDLLFPWGNEWNPVNAVWGGNSNSQTANVGSIPAGRSWVGAFDMIGNVWEWTSSLSMNYPYDNTNENDNDTSNVCVVRGGSWVVNYLTILRAASRDYGNPVGRINDLGFRCALSYNSES